jgi:type IV pilus assembly protein PilW
MGGPGLTIVEALVGMSLFLIVMFGVYLVYDTAQATFWKGEARANIQQETREALERMRRELRMAGFDPSGTGEPAVQSPSSDSLKFITDVDDNNVSDLVKYDRDAPSRTLRRIVRPRSGGGWGAVTVTTLATGVDSLTFQYFPSAVVPGLTRIRITIQASETVTAHPAEAHLVSTDVFLRNF